MWELKVLKSVAAGMLALGLGTATAAQDASKVVVVNEALGHLAERLLDGGAEVVFPVPAGVDPSFWRPSVSDISTIQSAELIVLNGAGFATWVDRVSLPRSRVVNTTAVVEDQFIGTDRITHSHGDGGEHSHEGVATYTWLDPALAIAQADAIAAGIARRGLVDAGEVYARLGGLTADLEALDRASQAALAPASGVAMIATHPRYQYFARRYSLSITALEWEAGAMPTAAELEELAGLAEELGARILIWEAAPPAEAIAAANALGLESVVFEPMAAQSGSASFFESYRAAVDAIAGAVGRLN